MSNYNKFDIKHYPVKNNFNDILCLFLFICIIIFKIIIIVKINNGSNFKRIYNTYDYKKNLCGNDKTKEYPLVLFIDPLDSNIFKCVKSCPKSKNDKPFCFNDNKSSKFNGCEKDFTYYENESDYFKTFCMPIKIKNHFKIISLFNFRIIYSYIIGILTTKYWIFIIMFICYFIYLIIFILITRIFGRIFFHLVLIIGIFAMYYFTIYLFFINKNDDLIGNYKYLFGFILLGVAIILTICYIIFLSFINNMITIINTSSIYFLKIPLSYLFSLLLIIIELILIYAYIYLLFLNYSKCKSEFKSDSPYLQFNWKTEYVNFLIIIAFIVFVIYFIVNLNKMFIGSLTTMLYFGDDSTDYLNYRIAFKRIFFLGLGTIVFTSILDTIFILLRIFFSVVQKLLNKKNDNIQNKLFKCCISYLSCLVIIMKFFNEHIIICASVTGKNYIKSARFSLKYLFKNSPIFLTIISLIKIFEYGGLFIGYGIIYLLNKLIMSIFLNNLNYNFEIFIINCFIFTLFWSKFYFVLEIARSYVFCMLLDIKKGKNHKRRISQIYLDNFKTEK